MVIHRVNLAVVGAMQIALQLQIVGGVRENQVNRACRKRVHPVNAVAIKDLVQRKAMRHRRFAFRRHVLPLPSVLFTVC